MTFLASIQTTLTQHALAPATPAEPLTVDREDITIDNDLITSDTDPT